MTNAPPTTALRDRVRGTATPLIVRSAMPCRFCGRSYTVTFRQVPGLFRTACPYCGKETVWTHEEGSDA